MDDFIKTFISGVPLVNKRFQNTNHTYNNVFSGTTAVNFIVENGFASERKQAVSIGNSLMKKGIFRHIAGEHTFIDSDMLFYKFSPGVKDPLPDMSKKEKRNLIVALNDQDEAPLPVPLHLVSTRQLTTLKLNNPNSAKVPSSENNQTPSSSETSTINELNVSKRKKRLSTFLVSFAPCPSKRMGHTAVLYDDKIWIYGGRGDKGNFTDLHAFSIPRKMWMDLPSSALVKWTPSQRRSSAGFLHNGKMIIFGGMTPSKWFNDMHSFDFEKESWEEIKYNSGTVPEVYLESAVLYKDSFYICGGQTLKDMTSTCKLWRYEIEKRSWTEVKTKGNLPTSRSGHSAVIYGDAMYIFGGQSTNDVLLNELFIYHFDSSEWEFVISAPGSNIPPPRYVHTATVINNEMYVFAGMVKDGFSADLFKYSFQSKLWTLVKPNDDIVPEKRAFHSATAYNDSIYIFGGSTSKGFTDSFFRFSTVKNNWKQIQVFHSFEDFGSPKLETTKSESSLSNKLASDDTIQISTKLNTSIDSIQRTQSGFELDHMIESIDKMLTNKSDFEQNTKKHDVQASKNEQPKGLTKLAKDVFILEKNYEAALEEISRLKQENDTLKKKLESLKQ